MSRNKAVLSIVKLYLYQSVENFNAELVGRVWGHSEDMFRLGYG